MAPFSTVKCFSVDIELTKCRGTVHRVRKAII